MVLFMLWFIAIRTGGLLWVLRGSAKALKVGRVSSLCFNDEATACIGYVLPRGDVSFWGVTVVTTMSAVIYFQV